MYNTLIINVDELWLKGRNRPLYFKAITKHLKSVIKEFHADSFTCRNESQRMIAKSESNFSEELIEATLKVPGVHSVSPARRIPVDKDAIMPAVIEEIKSLSELPKTFKVETKRAYKRYPQSSMDVSREVGHLVLEEFPELKVDVKTPELKVDIKILDTNIYISSKKLMAIGGLPFGTSGHLITMLSGGFDSPVASYLMAKRGCRQTFVFFYAYPFVGEEVKEKLIDIAKVLGQYQRFSKLYVVPFGDIQNIISKNCKEEYRTLLFRKHMIECASILSKKVKADGILTGDALGQVSSQTMGNISYLDNITEAPIFRPLIGHNKIEIIGLSKKIGTHDVSIIPHDDACSLFAPKNPIIKPDKSYLEEYSSKVSLQKELEECVDKAEVYSISLSGNVERLDNQ